MDQPTDVAAQAADDEATKVVSEDEDLEDDDLEDDDLEDEDDEDEDDEDDEDEDDEDDEDDEAKAEEQGPSTAELVAEFNAAVEAAVQGRSLDGTLTDQRDDTTGTLTDALLASVRSYYLKLPIRQKGQAKDYVADLMTKAMTTPNPQTGLPDFLQARSYMDIHNALRAPAPSGGGRERRAQVVVDPTEDFVIKATSLLFAANFLQVPEGVEPDWQNRVNARHQSVMDQVPVYANWLAANEAKEESEREPEPEVDVVVKLAAQIARGRSITRTRRSGVGKVRSGVAGPRRDVAKHILSAFADKAPGTFMSVSEIAAHRSEEYGDDHPSTGAVSARLFPKSGKVTIEGIRPDESTGKKGAVKL